MKIKKSILSMILVASLSVCLMVGCTHSDNSSKNSIEVETQKTKANETIKLFETYSKKLTPEMDCMRLNKIYLKRS